MEYSFPKKCAVQIRHQHLPVKCIVEKNKSGYLIKFTESIRAVAPGQSAVFYDESICLGGGVISNTN